MKRRPTRRDLLVVIGRLQELVGEAMAKNGDRNTNRMTEVTNALSEAHDLCIEARGQDPPIDEKLGPWGEREEKFRARV